MNESALGRTGIGFAETQEQWRSLLSHQQSAGRDFHIVVVTPEIDCVAEKSGREYLTIEEFAAPETLNAIGDENLERVAALARAYDKTMNRVARRLPRHEWVSAMGLYHHLKGFYDNLLNRAVPVTAAFEQLKPDYAVSFPQGGYRVSSIYLFDKPPLSLTSRIVPLVAAAFGCRVVELAGGEIALDAADDGRHGTSGFFSSLFNSVRSLFPGICRSPMEGKAEHSFDNPVSPLLIHNVFQDLGTRILELWRSEGQGRISTYGEIVPEREIAKATPYCRRVGRRLWQEVLASPEIRNAFRYGQVDLFSLAEPFLRSMTLITIPDLLAFAGVAHEAVKSLSKAVILTGGLVERTSVIARAASAYAIPVVSLHYGGFLGYSRLTFHERYDMAGADYFICGGPGSVKTFEKPYPSVPYGEDKRARPVAIGSPWIDELVSHRKGEHGDRYEKAPRQHRTIMYIAQALVGDNRYLGYVFPLEIWYWRFLRKTVELLSRYEEVRVLFKPPLRDRYTQIENPVLQWIESRKMASVEIMGDVPLKDVMGRADAFVVDSPSTPLLHLVATEKPFIIYSDRRFYKFIPDAEALLRKRAIFVDREGDFFEHLEAFLRKPDWSLEKPVNDEFLLAYGTFKSDGKSAERCVRFLQTLADGHAPVSFAESFS